MPSTPKSALPTPLLLKDGSTNRSSSFVKSMKPYFLAISKVGLTYTPGFPVQVEKLKKYIAIPIAFPGESGVPEIARSVWAYGVSKRFFRN